MGEGTKSMMMPGKISTETFCDAALCSYFTPCFEIFHFFESHSHPKKIGMAENQINFVYENNFFPVQIR